MRQCEDDGSRGDETAPEELDRGEAFAQDGPGEQDHKYNAELVDGSNLGGRAEGERAEVAEPGQAGSYAGGSQEKNSSAVEGRELAVRAKGNRDSPCHNEHDRGADRGGEIGVHVGDAELGQDGGGGGERGREQGPEKPVGHEVSVNGLRQGWAERPTDARGEVESVCLGTKREGVSSNTQEWQG